MTADARRQDRAARRLAQSEFRRPLLLEAGAGTGKTTTLVARILAWILGPGWRRHDEALTAEWKELGKRGAPPAETIAARVLGGVVAITFTEAAAAEMANRVARELAKLADADAVPHGWLLAELPPPDERARRAAALLATLDHLVVRTIHAFCRGLLADHPLEAGLHPELTVDAEGLRVEEVARETVETRLRSAYGASATAADPYVALAARGFGPRELMEALVVLARDGVPVAALDADPVAPRRVAALRRRLRDAATRVAELVGPRAGELGRSAKSLEVLEACRALAGDDAAPGDLDALLPWLDERFPPLLGRLADWSRRRFNKTEEAAFGTATSLAADLGAAAGELRARLRHAAALDPELLRLAHAALAPLHREVRRQLRSRGVVTFDDLLAEAASLLADPGVAARERARIDQLLVDEFQDTDRLQCTLVQRLALEGREERRPGLFLVGDPKQSIYGWRSADLAAYDDFHQRLVAAGGRREPLVENFRSVPAILEEVNRAVGPVMVERRGLQPAYQTLLPCDRLAGSPGFVDEPADGDAAGSPTRAAVEHWVSWRRRDAGTDADAGSGPDTPVTASYELEAAAVAADVADLHRRRAVPWKRFAVLLRSLGDLDVYLEALRRHGVPFAVGRDKEYYRRREVIDAAALVRAVLDPGDHLALLTTLRSPWVGVPDAALIPLWNRELPRLLTDLDAPHPARLEEIAAVVEEAAAHTPTDVPGIGRLAGWETSLLAAVEGLATARAAFREAPADRFVAELRRLFLPEVTAAARHLGAYRLANLERFFQRLAAALEDGGGDVPAVLRALRRSVAEAREAPEGKPREAAEDAVQVMTIHQAKGLDFPHVYLPQLHRGSGGETPVHETERTEDGFELRLFATPSLGFDVVEAQRARVEAAERVRLLYVAMTRAEERLVLLGRWPLEAVPGDPDQARTFLDLLAHREGSPGAGLAPAWETADGGGTAGEAAAGHLRDDAGVLWRFPALTAWPPPADGDGESVELPDPARVTAASLALAERRTAAARRMERPYSGRASEEAHHLLRQALADPEEGVAGRGTGATGEPSRDAAMAAGTAVHGLLEELDLAALAAGGEAVEAEIGRLRARLPALLDPALDEEERRAARERAADLLDRVAGGRLLQRLAELGPHGVVARELPLLTVPQDADGDTDAYPVGFVAGAVDLLYRDPGSGGLVVADYKTDRVASGDALADRAEVYRPQGRVYARAVQTALALPTPPRVELWFLHADRIVSLDVGGDGAPAAPPAPAAVEPAPAASPPRRPGEQIPLFDLD